MRLQSVLPVFAFMVILINCQSAASDGLVRHAVVGAGIGITDFHDDEGAYSPLVGFSACVAAFPAERWGAILDMDCASRSYTVATRDLLVAYRRVEAKYFDLMPVVYCDVGPRNLAYVGAGVALAVVTIHRSLGFPGHIHDLSERDLGGQWGFCIGAGVVTAVAGPVSVILGVRDRFVIGEHSETYSLMDEVYEIEEDVPLGGLELSLGLGLRY